MADKWSNWQANDLFGSAIPQLLPKWDSGQMAQPVSLPVGLGTGAGLAGGIVGTAVGNNLLSGALDAAKLPGDVYQGNVDLNSPAGFARAQNMAGMLMGGGMPMAEAGAAGIFGGKLAKTADIEAFQEAENMAARGINKDRIWNSTGSFQGRDKKWRSEIPDTDAVLRDDALASLTGPDSTYQGTAAGILDHPELFKAYPELATARVTAVHNPNAGGSYGSFALDHLGNPVIQVVSNRLTGSGEQSLQGILLHELQHAVQGIEGFAGGGNRMERPYRALAGEVEARNVQRRMDLLNPQAPWLSQDIPWGQEILRTR